MINHLPGLQEKITIDHIYKKKTKDKVEQCQILTLKSMNKESSSRFIILLPVSNGISSATRNSHLFKFNFS